MKYSYLVVYSANVQLWNNDLQKYYISNMTGNIHIISEKKLKYSDLESTKKVIHDTSTEGELTNILILNIIPFGKIKDNE